MLKRISVRNNIFTVVDIVSNNIEFQSIATETYLGLLGSGYYFYYDLFVDDNIRKSRSINYSLAMLVGPTGQPFDTEEELQAWVEENLEGEPGEPGGDVQGINGITDYRSVFETFDEFIYSGYNKNMVSFIERYKEGILTTAENVTNLEIDWSNRLTLTYI